MRNTISITICGGLLISGLAVAKAFGSQVPSSPGLQTLPSWGAAVLRPYDGKRIQVAVPPIQVPMPDVQVQIPEQEIEVEVPSVAVEIDPPEQEIKSPEIK